MIGLGAFSFAGGAGFGSFSALGRFTFVFFEARILRPVFFPKPPSSSSAAGIVNSGACDGVRVHSRTVPPSGTRSQLVPMRSLFATLSRSIQLLLSPLNL